jgi:hypothetical protein
LGKFNSNNIIKYQIKMSFQLLAKRFPLSQCKQAAQFHTRSIQLFNTNETLYNKSKSAKKLETLKELGVKPIEDTTTNQWLELEEGKDKEEVVGYEFDDHTSMAHHYLRQVRYVRKYMRQIKYEMPTFSSKYYFFHEYTKILKIK